MANKKYLDYDGLKYLWSKINTAVEDVTGYETVNLTITDPSGGGVSTTVTVTYNSTTETYSYNSSTITFKVPSNVSYTISFGEIAPYNPPKPITRTAIVNNSISFEVSYTEKFIEVKICDSAGNLVDIDNWSGGSNATGVAVITDQVSIIVAPDEWYTKNGNSDGAWNGNTWSAWGGKGTTVAGIKTTTDSSDAINDFAGSINTDAIISQLNGKTDTYSEYYTGAPAAEYCRAYSKGCKGVGQWYLPSAGEMNVMVQNRDVIEEALNKISGELFVTDDHSISWSSTQAGPDDAWIYAWEYETFNYGSKTNRSGVRPICQY